MTLESVDVDVEAFPELLLSEGGPAATRTVMVAFEVAFAKPLNSAGTVASQVPMRFNAPPSSPFEAEAAQPGQSSATWATAEPSEGDLKSTAAALKGDSETFALPMTSGGARKSSAFQR